MLQAYIDSAADYHNNRTGKRFIYTYISYYFYFLFFFFFVMNIYTYILYNIYALTSHTYEWHGGTEIFLKKPDARPGNGHEIRVHKSVFETWLNAPQAPGPFRWWGDGREAHTSREIFYRLGFAPGLWFMVYRVYMRVFSPITKCMHARRSCAQYKHFGGGLWTVYDRFMGKYKYTYMCISIRTP